MPRLSLCQVSLHSLHLIVHFANLRCAVSTPAMSTTATSLIPSNLSSSYHNAVQTTQRTASNASQALTTATSHVSQQVQSLGAATPKSAPAPTPVASPTPGKFRHPLTTEILRRNAASSLTERRVKGAVTNGTALLLSFVLKDIYYNR